MKILLITFLLFSYPSFGQTKEKPKTAQCKGITKAKTQCKHRTANLNGYCNQHSKQAK